MNAVTQYFRELTQTIGNTWNRFWFTPSDSFPLSVMRILTAAMAILYHFSFTTDLVRWFSSSGILPVETAKRISESSQYDTYYLSYLYFIDSPALLWVVHFAALAVLLLYLAGAFTRVTSVLSLAIVLSYMHRAPMLTGHMEPVLVLLLFYLCFAPSGNSLSVDRWLRKRKTLRQNAEPSAVQRLDAPSVWATISLRAMQIHVAGFYWMMALTKFRGLGWWNGDAMWGLIAYSESRLVDLSSLHGADYLLDFLTHAIVLFELLFPVFVWNRVLRPLMLGIAVIVWSFLALITGHVGFAMVMIVASLAFVSAGGWRGLLGNILSRRTAAVEQSSDGKVAAPTA